jgi:hypothetical protein
MHLLLLLATLACASYQHLRPHLQLLLLLPQLSTQLPLLQLYQPSTSWSYYAPSN